ncbi:DUF2933 domain-containing protein [Alteromonas mediterranea]|uniref:DUF2933 domain-containing protein n=1 Tax=Alteromonas mediterranea TaxID=314275 RepID=UPI002FE1A133
MNKNKPKFWRTPSGLAAMGLIGAASYFLFVEHGEHVFPYVPYLIPLLCPLMHVFMHGHHGKGHEEHTRRGKTFQEHSKDNDRYRQGFIDGLSEARQKEQKGEHNDAH